MQQKPLRVVFQNMTSFFRSVPGDLDLCDLYPDPFCHDLFHHLFPYLSLALLEMGYNRQDQHISLFKEHFCLINIEIDIMNISMLTKIVMHSYCGHKKQYKKGCTEHTNQQNIFWSNLLISLSLHVNFAKNHTIPNE